MKRIVCLFLSVCLLLAAVPSLVCAQAASSFTDAAEIQNRDKVELLVDLGLLSGYQDGSFQPKAYVTREQVSKLIALVCTEDPSVLPEDSAEISFRDTDASWAGTYITYCAAREILVGHNGSFRPKDNVSAQEFCKTLLVLLGHAPDRYTGNGWSSNVYTDALAAGILGGFTGSFSAALTRDDTALLLYNALLCPAVSGHTEDGEPIYVTDDLMNPISYLEYRYGVVRYSEVLMANECADLSKDDAPLAPGKSRLSGHVKTFDLSTDLALLGHTVNIYRRGTAYLGGVFASSDDFCIDVPKDTFSRMLSSGTMSICETTAFYRDYAAADAGVLDTITDADTLTVVDLDNDTVVDFVFVTRWISGTVTGVSPLQVRIDGKSVSAAAFRASDTFTAGMNVKCCTVCGTVYIQPNI